LQLLTPKEVASRLSVSPRTVYGWIAEGRLASVRLSERVTRVPEDAVEAMVRTALSPAKAAAPVSQAGTTGSSFIAAEPTVAYGPAAVSTSEARMALMHAARAEILAAAAKNQLENVRVFGSVARGDAISQSDVDILVDPLPGCTLFDLTGFRLAMEELLGVAVDVVPARSLNADIAKRVFAEAKLL